MAIILLITTTNEQTIELPILGKCILGRSSSCDFMIKDSQMSGKHGVFELNSKGELFYSDLGSTNGSYLNNSQIQKIQFKVSETLKLGNTLITIDEKRLNSRERLAIGKGVNEDDEHTLVLPSSQVMLPAAPEKEKGRVVLLNKKLGEKKSNWMGEKKNLIPQEKSSGKTKMLKLEVDKNKKGKKK